jgi:hypothetical protein
MPTTQQNTGFNLTKATHVAKYGGLGFIALLILLMVGRSLATAAYNYVLSRVTPEIDPPTLGFGQLPPIPFPVQGSDDFPDTFVLETPTGTLPSYTEQASVFRFTHSTVSLLSDDIARSTARQLGFSGEPVLLTNQLYRWTNTQPIMSMLDLDTESLHFYLSSEYLSRPDIFAGKKLPTNFDAITTVKQYLSRAGLLPADIEASTGTITMLRLIDGAQMPAIVLAEADVLKVDILREPVEGWIPVYSPGGTEGTISAIVGGDGGRQIFSMQFAHHTVDYSYWHTYPLRTATEAWNDLISGNGYIASGRGLEKAVIRRVDLGYFDSFEPQPYLQPIYVFTGDDDFIGYASALSSAVLSAPATPPTP